MTFPIVDVSFKDMPFCSWQTSSESQERRVACSLDSWTVVTTVLSSYQWAPFTYWNGSVRYLILKKEKSVII